jgi:hypothetical protein
MKQLGRLLVLAAGTWFAALAVSMVAYPLKQRDSPLFETLMALVVALLAVVATGLWLRGRTDGLARTGVVLGLTLFAVNVLLDLPLFLYGPMARPFDRYMAEIGFDYLVYPIVAIGTALFLEDSIARARREAAAEAASAPAPEAEGAPPTEAEAPVPV